MAIQVTIPMTKKTIMVLGASVFLLSVAGGLTAAVVLPRAGDWRAIRARIVQVEAAIVERENLLRAAEAIEANFSLILKNQERVQTLLPSRKDPAGSLSMLSGIAAAHGVILEEVGFLTEDKTAVPEAPPEAFRAFSLSIRASGSYQSLRSFLGALAKSLRLVDVRTITLAPQESGSDLLSMKAELATYYKANE